MAGEWKKLTLESCMATIIDYRGKSPKKTAFGVPLITAKIIKDGRIKHPEEFISEKDYDEWMRRGIPEPGDIVMTTEAPLGEVAQLDGQKIALAQRVITLRGKPGVLDNTFLKFLLQSELVQEELRSRSTGTTVLGIRQSELRKVNLTLPPINEQRAIAHILGTLDDKIELNRKMNGTLEAIARAIFKSWFVDPAQDELPKGWMYAPFDETVEVLGGGTPRTSVPEYWGGDIPWFSVVDAPRDHDVFAIHTEKMITQAGVENSSTQILPAGTTIISARGTVGRVALMGVPMAMNQSCYAFRRKAGKAFYTYFATRALVSELQQRAHGSVFDTITRDTLAGIKVPVPAHHLVENFERAVAPLLNRILDNLFESRTLAAIRDALLPKLLSGEIELRGKNA